MSQRSYPPRPLSEATEFSDTDFEDDYPDENFTAKSASSQTTVSTFESVKTPDTAGLGGFEFHFDDKETQHSPSIEGETVELYYGISTDERVPIELPIQKPPSLPAPTSQEPSSRPNAEDRFDESNVRDWTPEDVADWMCHTGHDDSVVDKFLDHDINGQILLDLQYEDLRELEISSHSKRNQVLESIKYLRDNSRVSLAPLLPQGMNNEDPREESSPKSRRGRRHHATSEDYISPGESISIVAIEQILPKEHVCSKGVNCKKWQRRQRKIQQLQEEARAAQVMPNTPMTTTTTATRPSDVEPSVVASSDVLGPNLDPPAETIEDVTPENLSKLGDKHSHDPQESVRAFLGFQHVAGVSSSSQQPLAEKLRNMPKLTIPVSRGSSVAHVSPASHTFRTPKTVVTPSLRRSKTPVSAIRHPSYVPQSAPGHDSMSFGLYSPADVYRLASPFSELDVPYTAFPQEPLARDTSQSVPPNMHYGSQMLQPPPAEPVSRPQSAQPSPPSRPHRRHPSFIAPSVPLLPEEDLTTPQTAISSSTKSNGAPQPPPRNPARLSMTTPQTAFPARPPSRASNSIPSSPYTHVSTPFPSISPPPPTTATTISKPPLTNSSSAPRTTSTYNSMSSALLPPSEHTPHHQGPMRRRKTTKLLRHEWQDGHFTLTGTSLAMYKSAESHARHSKALEYIDVDDYAIACSSVVSGKKLGGGFYKNILGRSGSVKGRNNNSETKEPKSAIENIKAEADAFAFSLIPAGANSKFSASTTDLSSPASSKKNPFSSANGKGNHYFSVKSRDERIDWMRELMLAKALKKGREAVGGVEGGRVEVNGMSAMI